MVIDFGRFLIEKVNLKSLVWKFLQRFEKAIQILIRYQSTGKFY